MKLRDSEVSHNTKLNVTIEQLIHTIEGPKSCIQKIKDTANNKNNTLTLCFDFMQNLPLPNIPVQVVVYNRQLWLNVFCIHDLKTNKATIYLYYKGEDNKSPDEACSMLLHYINTKVPNNIKNLILISDCP